MPNVKEAFDAVQTMTVTNLHSLAASTTTGAWQSAVIDVSSNLYLDILAQIVLVSSGTVASNKLALLLAYASLDGGTTYSDACSGSEGALTFTGDPPNLAYVGTLAMPTNSGTFRSPAFSLAKAFGGVLPPRVGLVIQNQSGVALAASGNLVKHMGMYITSV